jgi:hypothetical protein
VDLAGERGRGGAADHVGEGDPAVDRADTAPPEAVRVSITVGGTVAM